MSIESSSAKIYHKLPTLGDEQAKEDFNKRLLTVFASLDQVTKDNISAIIKVNNLGKKSTFEQADTEALKEIIKLINPDAVFKESAPADDVTSPAPARTLAVPTRTAGAVPVVVNSRTRGAKPAGAVDPSLSKAASVADPLDAATVSTAAVDTDPKDLDTAKIEKQPTEKIEYPSSEIEIKLEQINSLKQDFAAANEPYKGKIRQTFTGENARLRSAYQAALNSLAKHLGAMAERAQGEEMVSVSQKELNKIDEGMRKLHETKDQVFKILNDPSLDLSPDRPVSEVELQNHQITEAVQERRLLRINYKEQKNQYKELLARVAHNPKDKDLQTELETFEASFLETRKEYGAAMQDAISRRAHRLAGEAEPGTINEVFEKNTVRFDNRLKNGLVLEIANMKLAAEKTMLSDEKGNLLEKTKEMFNRHKGKLKVAGYGVLIGAVLISGIGAGVAAGSVMAGALAGGATGGGLLARQLVAAKSIAIGTGVGAALGSLLGRGYGQVRFNQANKTFDKIRSSKFDVEKIESEAAQYYKTTGQLERSEQWRKRLTVGGAVLGAGAGFALAFNADVANGVEQSINDLCGVVEGLDVPPADSARSVEEIVEIASAAIDRAEAAEVEGIVTSPLPPIVESGPATFMVPDQLEPPMPTDGLAVEPFATPLTVPLNSDAAPAFEPLSNPEPILVVDIDAPPPTLSIETFQAEAGDKIITLPHDGRYSLWNIAEGDLADPSKVPVPIEQPVAFAAAAERGDLQNLISEVVKEIESNPAAREILGMKVDNNPNEWLYAGNTFNVDAYNRLALIVGVREGILDPSMLVVASEIDNVPTPEVVVAPVPPEVMTPQPIDNGIDTTGPVVTLPADPEIPTGTVLPSLGQSPDPEGVAPFASPEIAVRTETTEALAQFNNETQARIKEEVRVRISEYYAVSPTPPELEDVQRLYDTVILREQLRVMVSGHLTQVASDFNTAEFAALFNERSGVIMDKLSTMPVEQSEFFSFLNRQGILLTGTTLVESLEAAIVDNRLNIIGNDIIATRPGMIGDVAETFKVGPQ